MFKYLFLFVFASLLFSNCSSDTDIMEEIMEEEEAMEELSAFCGISQRADEVTERYVNDLLFNELYFSESNDPIRIYQDSMYLPTQLRESLKSGLGLIHDLDSPESDSIFRILNLDPRHAYAVEDFALVIEPGENWVKNLQNGLSPTGNPLFDNYVDKLGLKLFDFSPNVNAYFFEYDVTNNINPIGVGTIMENEIPAVRGPVISHYHHPDDKGDRISYDLSGDVLEISITIAYGDCSNGCTEMTTWVYDYYPDCRVEFITRYDN